MSRVALVFRSIGERTSELALELALEHVRPDEHHVLEGTRPFSETVRRMLALELDADQVVAVDADCLITEDMRPFLEANREPYVDCFVFDRFRGRIHCGVHITRADVMQAMREIAPPLDDEAYVLRPESRLRKLALNRLGYTKAFKSFRIYHDHFQFLSDIWAKYALRELRSRTPEQRRKLEAALVRWREDESVDARVATEAVRWARAEVAEGADAETLRGAIDGLFGRAEEAIRELGLEERGPLDRQEVEAFVEAHAQAWPDPRPRPRVFGLGLSRTGTRSLTAALHVLGFDTLHYPIDEGTFEALSSGRLDFPALEAFDGLTDITVAPYYADLDARYPDARFILTVREEEGWLRSCEAHWRGRDAFAPEVAAGDAAHMKIRRFLRAAVYGSYALEPERFRLAHRRHVANVKAHFAGRPDKLLVLDIAAGQGWEELAPFLGRPVPDQPFPHKGGVLSARLDDEVGDPDD